MSIEDVKMYLRVEFDEDDGIIGTMMAAVESYIVDAVGKYDDSDAKARLLYLALIQDMYDNRMLMVTEQQRKRTAYTYASIILQLQLKYQEEVAQGVSIQEG